jgi:hypothetical protein
MPRLILIKSRKLLNKMLSGLERCVAEEMKWTIQKFMDEGAQEPFVARLWSGVFELRDLVMRQRAADDKEYEQLRRQFDDLYSPILDALASARQAQKRIVALVQSHRAKLASGEIVSYQANALELAESIALPLQEDFSAFLVAAVRATKTLQTVLRWLGVDIACLFAKLANFEAGLAALSSGGQQVLADYLREVRAGWSERLIERRNAQEHQGWRLPDVSYSPPWVKPVQMKEPEVDGQPVSDYVTEMLAHVLALTEELIAYAVQRGIGLLGTLAEIPPAEREFDHPKRFFFTVPALQPQARVWTLRYSASGFP